MPLVYPHLHQVAGAFLRREPSAATLQPTGLLHEVYLKLLSQRQAGWNDRAHFYTFAAQLMRRILADHARSAHAAKRGGNLPHVPLNAEIPWVDVNSPEIIDLNRALDELETLDARKVRLAELRYFLGCTVAESASLLGISVATAERDLTLLRSWLYARLMAATHSAPPR
jgi:RNA polymerase sigma factor (TIGR02999 family)